MNETVHRPIGRTQSSVRRICGKNSGKCGSADIDTPGFLRYNTRNVKYLYNIRKGVIKVEAKKNILTFAGLKALEDELFELKVVKRQEVAQKIKEAREQGDLSENAEYDAAKEAQGIMEAKLSQLKGLLANARLIDETRVQTNEVQILNKVKIKNTKNNAVMTYTLVSDSEANLKEGKISVSTPIAQGLMGKKVGDVVEIKVPSGLMTFEIMEISI